MTITDLPDAETPKLSGTVNLADIGALGRSRLGCNVGQVGRELVRL